MRIPKAFSKKVMSFVMILLMTVGVLLPILPPVTVSAATWDNWPYPTNAIPADDPDVWMGADIGWYLVDVDADNFYVSTAAELYGLAYLVDREYSAEYRTVSFKGKTITLTNDIDLSTPVNAAIGKTRVQYAEATYGEAWYAIGWGNLPPASMSYCHFMGTFDGAGYAVSGLTFRSLFGVISDGAVIKNLTTHGTLNSGNEVTAQEMAGIVNIAKDATLVNLKSDVTLDYVAPGHTVPCAGIVAMVVGDTIVYNCEFSGTFNTNGYGNFLAGIVGQYGFMGEDTTLVVENCINTADINGHYDIGGIVGGTPYAYVTGVVEPKSANIRIINCANSGNIMNGEGNAYTGVGGILGASGYNAAGAVANIPSGVTIDRCVNTGNVTGTRTNVGGIVGYVQQGQHLSLTNSYNWGNVTTKSTVATQAITVGGIIGLLDNAADSIIENCYSTGSVVTGAVAANTPTSVGGIVGKVNGGVAGTSNDYYLVTSVSGAVDSAPYRGVTAKTAIQMLAPEFVTELGGAYRASPGNYPVLRTSSYPVLHDSPIVTFSGTTSIIVGEDAKYTVSVANMERLATVTVWFEIEDPFFTGKTFSGLNGFTLLGDINWIREGDKWIGRATLLQLGEGVTTTDALDIFEMVFSSKTILGETTVKLTGIQLSGYDEVGVSVFINAEIADAMVVTLVAQYFSRYDVNRDGVVNQLDLTAAQRYYMVETGDDNWSVAQRADVNNDGVVNIEDLILVLNNIVW